MGNFFFLATFRIGQWEVSRDKMVIVMRNKAISSQLPAASLVIMVGYLIILRIRHVYQVIFIRMHHSNLKRSERGILTSKRIKLAWLV